MTHPTLEADEVQFLDRLLGVRSHSNMALFLDSTELALETVHEV